MGKKIIINGADFSQNALLVQVCLRGAIVVGIRNQKATMRVSTQSTVVMYKPSLNNTLWGTDNSSDYQNKASYALNEIPKGTTKIIASDTEKGSQISICIFDENYAALMIPAWSEGYSQEIDLSNYPNAKYHSINYKNTNVSDINTLSIQYSME